MVANALTIFEAGIPAHITAAMNEEGSGNIVARATINSLTFEGKVWSINLDGKKTKLLRTNADGEEEPVSIFTGVILNYNKERGREWYSKPYDPKNPALPDCWSEDSKMPEANVPQPQSKSCATCPKSKKGSASTQDGKPTVACGQFQKLALIPATKIGGFPPLRLRIKITSIYDKSGVDTHPGWHAWDQYIALLVSKGVNNTALLPTKIKFDPATAYPKLMFSPGKDWLDEATFAIAKELAASDATIEALTSSYDPTTSKTGNKPLPEDEEEAELPAAAQPVQARPGKAFKCRACGGTEDAAGLPAGFRYHDLRHYLASLLIAHGADVKTVQARLRHGSATTTLNTYSHLWPDKDESTKAIVDSVIKARFEGPADSSRTAGGAP